MAYTIPFSNVYKKYFRGQEGGIKYNITQNQATSEVNDFIPYHALMTGTLVGVGNHRTLLYDLNVPKTIDFGSKQYEAFVTSFTDGCEWRKFIKKGNTKEYRVRTGQLIEVKDYEIIPLVTLVVNKAHMLNIDKTNPDSSKFFIVISKAFLHESHRSMYLAFKKYLFDVVKGIDILHTESISRFCYKSMAIDQRKPKSIAEAKNMSKDLTIDVMKHLIYG